MNPAADAASNSRRRSFVPNMETARDVLGFLAGIQPDAEVVASGKYEPDDLAAWLVNNELGSLAQAGYRNVCPELAGLLTEEVFRTAAQNAVNWRHLREIDSQLARFDIPCVLLKGAALAETVYARPEQRSMTDVDIWFREQDIGQVCQIMSQLGFVNFEETDRPLALQVLSDGEIKYFYDDQPPTLVELHLSPFKGWWLQRTAAIDKIDSWSRRERIAGWQSFYELSAEDATIHISVHQAVNHQFGMSPLRSIMDLALTIQARPVDWDTVVYRARQWRVSTAVWLALAITQQLTGAIQLEATLDQLRPSAWRRRRLQQYVSADSILAGKDLRDEQERYLFLLFLVDRPRDVGRLLARTLWPEDEWLDARYGGGVNHWQHIRRMVRQGGV